ncbi:MAG: cytochrome c peroxidase, partial [Planctomycetota bacterium]
MFPRAAFSGLLLAAAALWQGPDAIPRDSLPAELSLAPPLGFPDALVAPAGNEFTAERTALGRALFFDPLLSRDRTVACASCHQPEHGMA